MFFAKPGEYEPCGIFTIGHFILIAITLVAIIIALKNTVNKKDVKKIIKSCTIFIWICEIIIISFKIAINGASNLNEYVPLYYCSLLLYSSLFSSLGKGKLKRIGDVFLATGGIVGGIVFIFFPTTSLPAYPMLHLVSIHSFIFHGIMVYLGLLINLTNYIEIEKRDIIYYSNLTGIICILAYVVNEIFGSNLMFISENFPGTVIEYIYNFAERLFTPFMILAQMFLPFYAVYGIVKLIKRRKKSIVIYGGSFNPPHNIHFAIAEQVIKQYPEVEKVIFIPVNNKYPKEGIIENKHRYNMLKEVIDSNSKFELSDLDMYGEKSLLTIKVLEEMQETYKNKELWVLVGSDNLKKIHKWYRAEDLLSKYKIIVMEREGDTVEDIINKNEILKRNKENIKKLNKDIKSNLSSTYIRNKIKTGEDILDSVPYKVYEYIKENDLYRR